MGIAPMESRVDELRGEIEKGLADRKELLADEYSALNVGDTVRLSFSKLEGAKAAEYNNRRGILMKELSVDGSCWSVKIYTPQDTNIIQVRKEYLVKVPDASKLLQTLTECENIVAEVERKESEIQRLNIRSLKTELITLKESIATKSNRVTEILSEKNARKKERLELDRILDDEVATAMSQLERFNAEIQKLCSLLPDSDSNPA